MQDEQFDRWLRDTAPSYHPPPAPDADAMWMNIAPRLPVPDGTKATRTPWWANQWMRAAAMLAIGVALGRVSVSTWSDDRPSTVTANVAARNDRGDASGNGVRDGAAISALSGPATDEYLGQTVALLASLQDDAPSSLRDDRVAERAGQLLSTTRFLLDSPSSTDARVRALLEDLELVLVQVVQMPSVRSSSDVQHIHQAMSERDVMPRLRTAVAYINSAD